MDLLTEYVLLSEKVDRLVNSGAEDRAKELIKNWAEYIYLAGEDY